MRRILRRFEKAGPGGIIHKARDRLSNRRMGVVFIKTVLARYQEKYLDFGPTLAAEKLEEDGLKINPETLRLLLKRHNLWQGQRKRKLLRKRRARRECFGELLQLDGSFHQWFGICFETTCLMNLIDDATSTVLSFMAKEETTYAALTLLRMWIDKYGIPKAIYVDLKTVYVSQKDLKPHTDLEHSPGFTHFKRVCQDLGIRIIKAYSPQAKGRVERVHRTFQDRFIKELRLREINDIAKANEYLQKAYLLAHNKKFSVTAQSDTDSHRPVISGLILDNIVIIQHRFRA
jgi:hypothetical protein